MPIQHVLIIISLFISNVYSELSRASQIKFTGWQSITPNPVPSDFPETPYLTTRTNTAIGFTGGGARAYVAAIGQLGALTELGLASNIKYIGGISGGAWATTTYTYAQNIASEKEFLGTVTNPEEITYSGLQVMSPKCARGFAAPNLTLIGLNAYNDGTVSNIADAWCYGVFKTYLEPAGITDKSYFSWSEETVKAIKDKNLALKNAKFLIPTNSKRPYPILGTTLVGPVDGAPYKTDTQNYTMLDITPLYIGQFKKQSVKYDYHLGLTHHKTVGGAIEPFAFDRYSEVAPYFGLASDHTSASFSNDLPSEVFDLSHAAGLSSYAPGSFVVSLPLNISEFFGMSFNYWSPSDTLPSGSKTFFADGGSYENIPLIAFLQRRVEKIVLFFNSNTPLQPSSKWNVAANQTYDGQVSDCLSSFFGIYSNVLPWYSNVTFEYEKNQVYSVDDYIRVIQGLQAAQSKGEGIVATFDLTTIENSWWGIPAGITSQVTFVYLGRTTSWEAKLSSDMRKLLVPSNPADVADLSVDVKEGEFKDFPHYFTTGGSINYQKANVLADLTGWTVLNNAKLFESIFS